MNSYQQGDIVEYNFGLLMVLKGKGRVVGKAITPQAFIGENLIIEDLSGNLPNEQYPFTHFAAPECCLTRIENSNQVDSLPVKRDKFKEWNEQAVHFKRFGLRKGQCWMNALAYVDPDLHRLIVGGLADCYYNDGKCDELMERLMKEWAT